MESPREMGGGGWASPYGDDSGREHATGVLNTFTLVSLLCPQHRARNGEEREGMGGCHRVRWLLMAVESYFKGIPSLILSF